MIKKKIKVIDGVKYYSDRPDRCRDCKFWKNRATACCYQDQFTERKERNSNE